MYNFAKRINRRTFIAIFLKSVGATLIYSVILEMSEAGSLAGTILGIGMILIVCYLVVLWLCIAKQRANDISGKYAILLFLVFGFTPLFWLYALIPGEKKPNKYGAIPN